MFRDEILANCAVSVFCSYNEQISTSEETVLRSLLHQLLLLRPRAQTVVRNTLVQRDRHQLEYKLDFFWLWKAIRDVFSMNEMKYTFICVDAIEELNANDCRNLVTSFTSTIDFLNQQGPDSLRVRIFLSSRPNPQYRKSKLIKALFVESQHMEQDIKNYLRGSIDDFNREQSRFASAVSRSGPQYVVNRIAARAHGMFL